MTRITKTEPRAGLNSPAQAPSKGWFSKVSSLVQNALSAFNSLNPATKIFFGVIVISAIASGILIGAHLNIPAICVIAALGFAGLFIASRLKG